MNYELSIMNYELSIMHYEFYLASLARSKTDCGR